MTRREIGPIESAFARHDYPATMEQIGRKLARKLDQCESSRDVRPIARGLVEICETMQRDQSRDDSDTPLAAILREAEAVIASGSGSE